jgi:outer membrane receptor for ferrienterochelin and colicins
MYFSPVPQARRVTTPLARSSNTPARRHARQPAGVLRCGLLAAAVAATLPAFAQQTAAVTGADTARVEVHGTTTDYDPRRDDTASKIVVTQDELLKYGDTSIADALKRVPGVTVSGGGRGTEIRMHGLGNGYTQILLDGERAPANFSIDSLAPELIERIEVLRVASAEFSTQSIAGTINIVLKKSVKRDQQILKAGYANGKGTLGPNASLQLSDRLGKLSYTLAGSASQNRIFENPATVERAFDAGGRVVQALGTTAPDVEHRKSANLNPRINWTFDNGDTLTSQTFLNYFQDDDQQTSYTDDLSGSVPAPAVLAQHNTVTYNNLREEVNWVHKLATDVKLDAKVGASRSNIAQTQFRDGSNDPGVPALHETQPAGGIDRRLTTTGKISDTVWPGHTLTAGWDAEHERMTAQQADRDALDPAVLLGDDAHYGAKLSRLAFFAQDDWNVTTNWSVYLGARWEGILIRTEGDTFPTAHSRSKVWSPLFQTLYKLPGAKGDQVRFAVSRTFKTAPLINLIPVRFKSANNTLTSPDVVGNPDLVPEVALGFDASYEHYWREGALFSVSASERRIRDYVRNILTLQDDGRWTSSPANAGRARTRGLELEVKFPLKAVLATTVPLDLHASVSRNWSNVDAVPGPDNRLDAQTPLSATLGADYTSSKLTFGASYVFKNAGQVRVLANETSYASVQRDLDAYASYQIDARWQLRVAVANLLGQDRIAARSFVFPDGSSSDAFATTSSYRTVRTTLQLKF